MEKVEARIAEVEEDAARAERRIEAWVGEIAAGAVDEIIGEVEALRRELNGRWAVLRFLGRLAPAGSEAGRRANQALPSAPPGEPWPGPESHPAKAVDA